MAAPPQADQPVLSTLNKDGSRRWLRPKPSSGRYLNARRGLGYALIVLYNAIPFIPINGKPAILLDIAQREFTFFGLTLYPTDTLLLAFFMLALFVAIFLLTALVGRVWCGWACPQTVYMELVYRPIERLWEGRHYRTQGKSQLHPLRRLGKYATFFIVSLHLAHTFLAYFVGAEEVWAWSHQSPFEHPTAFLVVMSTTGLMMLDFCLLREQICVLMCPYGRFQSVLLDRDSLIVTYDPERGEPRGKLRKGADAETQSKQGDCIDCKLCVVTCPTGIDIRDGLQMECVNCTQCIDACDTVMESVGRPRGLIRYSSQRAIEEGTRRLLRARVVIYPLLLVIAVGLFAASLAARKPVDITFIRTRGRPYQVLDSGAVSASVRVKLLNRSSETQVYDVALDDEGISMTCPDLPLTIAPGGQYETALTLVLPKDRFTGGRADIGVIVTDGAGQEFRKRHAVPGPLTYGAD